MPLINDIKRNQIRNDYGLNEYKEMYPYWIRINDVLAGSKEVLKPEKIDSYLIQFSKESDDNFKQRKRIATFENFFSPTIRNISVLPFTELISVPDELEKDDFFKSFRKNTNAKGENLTSFFRKVMSTAMAYGMCGVLIDNDDQQMSELSNPTMSMYNPLDIIQLRGIYSLGKFILQRLAIIPNDNNSMYELIVYDLNMEKTVTVTKYVSVSEEKFDTSIIQIDHIPFYTFYISSSEERNSPFDVNPVFYDLLVQNLSHFNKENDKDNLLKYCSFPLLYAKGLSSEAEIENLQSISYKKLFYSRNTDASFGYIEHSGRSVDIAMQDIINLEKKMKVQEIEFLLKKNVTATEISSQDKKANSVLKSLAIEMDDFIYSCLKDVFLFKGKEFDEEYVFETFKKFSISDQVQKNAKIIFDLYKANGLSLETLLNEFKRYEVLARELDVQDELNKVSSQNEKDMKDIMNLNKDEDEDEDEENSDGEEEN